MLRSWKHGGSAERWQEGLASSFGGGLGRLREVCGCVSGMALVCGALEGYTDPKAAAEKQDHYKKIQKLVTAFKDENGSYICRELLAGINSDTTPLRRRERRATIKNAHAQSLLPVQRIFWRDTWKNYRNKIEFPILRRIELISEVSLWQQKNGPAAKATVILPLYFTQ